LASAIEHSLLNSHFRAVVESSDDAILTKNREAVITSWNRAAERLYGYSADEAIGSPISMLIPPERAGEERRILEQILAGQRVDHYETERVAKDGRRVIVSLSVSPIADESETISGASVIARDITAQRRAAERAQHLQRLTTSLSKELTPASTIEVLLDEAVPALGASAGAVGLLDDSGTTLVLAGSAGYSDEGLAGWREFQLDAPVPMSEAVRTREPIWCESSEELKAGYPVLANEEIRFGALAVIPLVVKGIGFGAISLSFEDSRQFTPEERAFMHSVSQQAAYALDRTRLYEAEREARKSLEFLARASEVLAQSLDAERTLEQLAFLAVPRIADWCSLHLVEEGKGYRNVVVAHADPEKVEFAREFERRYPPDPEASTGVPNVIKSGQPELYEEISDELLEAGARDAEHLAAIRGLGLVSAMIVPLTARGRTLGALTLIGAESGRRFDAADLELAMDLAGRAAMAIDNSALYRREHEAAVTLQRALLPRRLPSLDGAELASRYLPAEEAFEVGGDWYDVVQDDAGDVTLSVGDVAGHGTRAASVMGQLRIALRAYVSAGYGPRESLQRLNRLLMDFDEPLMATVLQMHFDWRSRRCEFVRAGHPPPLMRTPDGEVELLFGSSCLPLGVFEDVSYEAGEAQLAAGSTLLLYTDGLIERRGATIEDGMELLRQALREAPTQAEPCLDFILERFGTNDADDVAIVALKLDE
jgi:PAS domain S-box-containing protein